MEQTGLNSSVSLHSAQEMSPLKNASVPSNDGAGAFSFSTDPSLNCPTQEVPMDIQPIVIQFHDQDTLKVVYEHAIKTMEEAVMSAAGNKQLLREYELKFAELRALAENLQRPPARKEDLLWKEAL